MSAAGNVGSSGATLLQYMGEPDVDQQTQVRTSYTYINNDMTQKNAQAGCTCGMNTELRHHMRFQNFFGAKTLTFNHQ